MGIQPSDYVKMQERLDRVAARKKRLANLPVHEAAAVPEPRPEPAVPTGSVRRLGVFNDALLTLQNASQHYECKEIVFNGLPIGKPRMTRLDQFKKRPAAERYWNFKAMLRLAAGHLPAAPGMVFTVAWLPMPESWNKKKKATMEGQPCRNIPDWDNIGKAVCDSLFAEDKGIWAGLVIKRWCRAGQEGLNIKIFYAKP